MPHYQKVVRFLFFVFVRDERKIYMTNQNSKQNIKKITLCAVMIALGTVLSMIKIDAPLGGGVTLLSMVPVAFLSCMLGLKWGFAASSAYAAIQLMISIGDVLSWGLTATAVVVCALFDYVIPYALLGISGIFRKKGIWGIVSGVGIATFIRFLCHYFTGVVIFDIWCPWANVYWYSLCYNGAYMLPEIILTCVGTALLVKTKAIQKMLKI